MKLVNSQNGENKNRGIKTLAYVQTVLKPTVKRKGVGVKTQLLSVHRFSESTGISKSTIYRKAKNGLIPSVSVAGQVRIPVWCLDDFTRRPGQLPVWIAGEEVAVDE